MACDKITKDFIASAECHNMTGGLRKRVILINYDDIDRDKLTVTNGVCSSIKLKNTAKAFAFTGSEDANVGSFTYARGKYVGMYEHKVALKDFVGGKGGYAFTEELKNSRVVAIVENVDYGADKDQKYTIYGLNAGMVMSADSGTTEMADNVVADIEIHSTDTSKEPNRPINLYATDLTSTDTMVNGLLTTAGA